MPIYEYKCNSCGNVSEVMQKFSDPAPEKCEKCSGGPLTKLISQTSFILKGGGWYATDYKKSTSSSSKTSEAGGGSGGDKKEESSSASSGEKCGAPACATAGCQSKE